MVISCCGQQLWGRGLEVSTLCYACLERILSVILHNVCQKRLIDKFFVFDCIVLSSQGQAEARLIRFTKCESVTSASEPSKRVSCLQPDNKQNLLVFNSCCL